MTAVQAQTTTHARTGKQYLDDLGGRGELYERFYLSDSFRMTALAYTLAEKDRAVELVESFLHD